MAETVGGAAEQVGFRCPRCAAELVWYPRLAGRKVSCPTCAHVFVAPTRSAVEAASQPPAPAPRQAPNRAAELARLYLRPRRHGGEEELDEHGGLLRSWVVPSVLLALGLAAALAQVTWSPKPIERQSHWDLGPAQMLVVLLVLVATLLAATAAFTHLMNIDFGRLGPASLKLSAIAVFAGSLALAVARLDKDRGSLTGPAMGWHLLIVLYWGLFSALFELELWETLLVCFVVAVVQAVVLGAILA